MSVFEEMLDMAYVEREPDYKVSAQGLRSIRRAITFGLHALVQTEKGREAHSYAEQTGKAWPEELILSMPHDSFRTSIAELVEALLWVEHAGHVKEVRDDAASDH